MTTTESDTTLMEEFNELAQATEEDLIALEHNIVPLTKSFFDEKVEYDERMKIIGEAINCTLLANNHRGGYTADNNGIQTLKKNLEEDFGFKLDEYAERLGFSTMLNFMKSAHMKPYVRMTLNRDNAEVFEGCPFENDLLAELMSEIKLSQETQEEKDRRKQIERRVRMDVAKINPEAVEGRLRIYKIINQIGGDTHAVTYQSVQAKYNEIYGKPLNKAEMKSFFGIGEALKALQEYATDDILISTSSEQSGSIFLKLKRPLKVIEEDYARLLEEEKNSLSIAEAANLNKKTHIHNPIKTKAKKTPIAPTFEFNDDSLKSRNALLDMLDEDHAKPTSSRTHIVSQPAFENAQAPQKSVSKKKKKHSNYTHTYGDKKFSSDDSSGDDGEVNEQSSDAETGKQPINSFNNKHTILDDTSSSESNTRESSVIQNSPREQGKSSNIQTKSKIENVNQMRREQNQFTSDVLVTTKSADPASSEMGNVSELIAKAYVFGFLRSIQPLMAPVLGLVKKLGVYMKTQGLKTADFDIEAFVRSLDGELKFHNDGLFVSLEAKKGSRRK